VLTINWLAKNVRVPENSRELARGCTEEEGTQFRKKALIL